MNEPRTQTSVPPSPPAGRGLTRRRLLVGGGAGLGLLLGFALWPRIPELELAARDNERVFNGWLKIGSDGRVVVIVPQAEMGQGVFTALPMILADELGAAWGQVAVEPAPMHATYVNTALIDDELAFMALPSMLHSAARWGAIKAMQLADVQVTGGSSSVRGFYPVLREAGAAARELLCRAAAARWSADWKQCRTQDGFVILEDRTLAFGDLALEAAALKPEGPPTLLPETARRLVGTNVPRLDIPSKVDGTAQFGLDVRIPGMLYASVRAGPVNGAALVSVDEAPARALPGVLHVVKGSNWVGVVAENWWTANRAVQALAPVFDTGAVAALRTATIDAALHKALESPKAHVYEARGDVSAAFAGDAGISADYAVPHLAHACMEPMNATVRINAEDETVEVWAPTQSTTMSAMAVAGALGVGRETVRVFPTFLGGGFGRKVEGDACAQAALLARAAGAPVQLIWSREEDFRQDKFRPAAAARLRARLDTDGRIKAFAARMASDSVSGSLMRRLDLGFASSEPDRQSVDGMVAMPYDISSLSVDHVLVESGVPLGYWRSVGHSFTAFFRESFLDELAVAARQDPLAFRLAHLAQSPRHAAVLKVVAERAGWTKPLKARPGVRRGRGIALHEAFRSIVAQVVEVSWSRDAGLAVDRVVCGIDCGLAVHPDTIAGQMEGSIIFGLTAALNGQITLQDGVVAEQNFDSYPLLGLAETPEIEVHLLPSGPPIGGVGEPGVPPLAPALANAIHDATGVRLRRLPFDLAELTAED